MTEQEFNEILIEAEDKIRGYGPRAVEKRLDLLCRLSMRYGWPILAEKRPTVAAYLIVMMEELEICKNQYA